MNSYYDNIPITEGLIYDYTKYFASNTEKQGICVFNNTMFHLDDQLDDEGRANYFLLAARVFQNGYYPQIALDLPPMWEGIKVEGYNRTVVSGWDAGREQDYSLLLLAHITNLKNPKILASIPVKPPNAIISAEDPRIYKKANGDIIIGTRGRNVPCNITNIESCVYQIEWKINVNIKEKIFEISDNYIIPCEKGVLDLIVTSDIEWFRKNWSHWTINGVNYWTDFKPFYTIYAETSTNSCLNITAPIQNKIIDEMKNNFKIFLNKIFTNKKVDPAELELFQFDTTSPSIKISESLRKNLFPTYKNVMCGVTHCRSQTKLFLINNQNKKSLLDALYYEKSYYQSFINLFDVIDELYKRDYIHLHADFYLMCVYYFNADENSSGKRGDILAVSDIFLPFAVNDDGSPASRFSLVFPTGIMNIDNNLVISYGEGDCRARMLNVNAENIGCHYIDTHNNILPENYTIPFSFIKFKTGNFSEYRSILDMKKDILSKI